MDFGTGIILASLIASLSFLIRNLIDNLISGLWMRLSGEIQPGDEVRVKSDFGEMRGMVRRLYLRNVVIRLKNGEELLIQARKVLDDDVIRKRGSENEVSKMQIEEHEV